MSPVSVETILSRKRDEVAQLAADRTWASRKRNRARHSFRDALARPGLAVIAEIKRSSPSTGDLHVDIDALLASYVQAGVDALSILTDAHFGMDAAELARLAERTDLPILRKEFTLSKDQILQADLLGADAVLLIATFLSTEELVELGSYAETLELDVLYEAHSRDDLVKIPQRAKIIGVNNRNLASGDYRTDLSLSQEMLRSIPEHTLRVAESGYDEVCDVPDGFDAVLMGTGLIRAFHRDGVEGIKAALIKSHGMWTEPQ